MCIITEKCPQQDLSHGLQIISCIDVLKYGCLGFGFDKNVGEVFSKNPLHFDIQSNNIKDGKVHSYRKF